MLNAVLIGSALQLFLIPAFGALSDRVGRRPVYMAGALGAAVWAFAFFPLLDTGRWWGVVAAATGGLVFHALMYGPQAAFIAELFDTRVRYSGASMGYQVAGIFGGALAPIIATALLAWSGSWVAVSLYVVGCAVRHRRGAAGGAGDGSRGSRARAACGRSLRARAGARANVNCGWVGELGGSAGPVSSATSCLTVAVRHLGQDATPDRARIRRLLTQPQLTLPLTGVH